MGSLLKALPFPYWLSKPSEINFWFDHGDWGTWKMFSVKFEKGFNRKWSREVKVNLCEFLCEEEEELREWRPVTLANRNRNNRWEIFSKDRWKHENRNIWRGGGEGGGSLTYLTFSLKLTLHLHKWYSKEGKEKGANTEVNSFKLLRLKNQRNIFFEHPQQW